MSRCLQVAVLTYMFVFTTHVLYYDTTNSLLINKVTNIFLQRLASWQRQQPCSSSDTALISTRVDNLLLSCDAIRSMCRLSRSNEASAIGYKSTTSLPVTACVFLTISVPGPMPSVQHRCGALATTQILTSSSTARFVHSLIHQQRF